MTYIDPIIRQQREQRAAQYAAEQAAGAAQWQQEQIRAEQTRQQGIEVIRQWTQPTLDLLNAVGNYGAEEVRLYQARNRFEWLLGVIGIHDNQLKPWEIIAGWPLVVSVAQYSENLHVPGTGEWITNEYMSLYTVHLLSDGRFYTSDIKGLDRDSYSLDTLYGLQRAWEAGERPAVDIAHRLGGNKTVETLDEIYGWNERKVASVHDGLRQLYGHAATLYNSQNQLPPQPQP